MKRSMYKNAYTFSPLFFYLSSSLWRHMILGMNMNYNQAQSSIYEVQHPRLVEGYRGIVGVGGQKTMIDKMGARKDTTTERSVDDGMEYVGTSFHHYMGSHQCMGSRHQLAFINLDQHLDQHSSFIWDFGIIILHNLSFCIS